MQLLNRRFVLSSLRMPALVLPLVLVNCGGEASKPISAGTPIAPTDTSNPTATPPAPTTTGNPAPPTTPPPASNPAVAGTTITNIQNLGGWESCTATYNDGGTCASGLGDAEFSMQQGVSHPSLTGSAAQFWLGGATPYSNALWWKHLSPDNGAKNFVYDLYLYITDPYAPQSLEFDVNHSIGDRKFIFGTECDFKGTHTWRVWDTANVRWIGTDVPCEPFQGHSWNHLTFRFQRTDDNKAAFVSVTINGRTLHFNRRFDPLWITASEINVAFQMDGNSSQQPFSVWLDKVSLTYW